MSSTLLRTFLAGRRHDRSTGAVVWASTSPDTHVAHGIALAVTGPHVVVAGASYAEGQPLDGNLHPLLAVYDEAGALQSLEVADEDNSEWAAIAATSDGGVALVGDGPTPDIVVSRLDAELAPQWTLYAEGALGMLGFSVAAGPAGTIAITGHDNDPDVTFVRRLDADGATMWTTQFGEGAGKPGTAAAAVEFGPGFIAAIGSEDFGDSQRVWVRRFKAE